MVTGHNNWFLMPTNLLSDLLTLALLFANSSVENIWVTCILRVS